ncbi:hypothetical protein EVAR_84513_1 [Eumeta japonica]|uniref:Uncharacterized protein n=1 Tax=Eumeta variegata TaxID=151549 RepID=A0A4C1UJ92_EUMVA|nr:hypothetical protein EVAR_84513_1 [Eumeta japonica]
MESRDGVCVDCTCALAEFQKACALCGTVTVYSTHSNIPAPTAKKYSASSKDFAPGRRIAVHLSKIQAKVGTEPPIGSLTTTHRRLDKMNILYEFKSSRKAASPGARSDRSRADDVPASPGVLSAAQLARRLRLENERLQVPSSARSVHMRLRI